jgi:hypothetical protein
MQRLSRKFWYLVRSHDNLPPTFSRWPLAAPLRWPTTIRRIISGERVPGPGTFTLKTSHAQDATTTSTKQVLASTVAEQKVTHSYGAATTTVQLTHSDLDAINLVVPEQAPVSQP